MTRFGGISRDYDVVQTVTRIGMITCWYQNISMANYSKNLKEALEKKKGLQVKIVSSHCFCRQRYKQKRNIFEEGCRLVSIPYIVALTNKRGLTRIFAFPVQSFLHFLRALQYWTEMKDCDIIHYQQSASHSFGIMPLFFLLLLPTSKRRIVTIHNIVRLSSNSKFRFLGKIYSRATKIIVHSHVFRESVRHLDIPENKIKVIYHGSPSLPLRGFERREITFFGAPEERKGISTVLKALKVFKDKGEKLSVSVYGIYSEKEKDVVVSKAKSIGVEDQLFWGGRLTETQFDRKMQESLFTLAVYDVAGSSVVTRAMANATPIIASDVGSAREYLGEAGVIIPPNNPVALAGAMEMLLENETKRKKLGKEGRDRAQKLLSWTKIAENTLDVYRDSMSDVQHPPGIHFHF